jgi:hypothetical protein
MLTQPMTQPAPKASAPLIVMIVLFISVVNAYVDWGMLVSQATPAYPRQRLFSILTLTRLMPVLVGTLLTTFFMNLWAAVLAGTIVLASHSLIFWLGVAPSPRQVCASQVHSLVKRVCTVGWYLVIGVWVFADIVRYLLPVGLLDQVISSFAIAAPVQPSVAWRVSGACVLVAVLLWGQAYKRFKYMEGVPHLSRSGRR